MQGRGPWRKPLHDAAFNPAPTPEEIEDWKRRNPDKEEDALVSKAKVTHCLKLDFHAILILVEEIVLGVPMMECNVVKHLQ